MPKKQTIIVTGGAGFIGSQLAERLVKDGHRVVVIDDLSAGKREYVPAAAGFYQMNVADKSIVDIFLKEKPDIVFHLAAQIDLRFSVTHPVRDAETNIHGSLRVMEACVRSKAKKIIFSSSGGAIYHSGAKKPTPETAAALPKSPYGVAKLAFELYLRSAGDNYGLPSVSFRYANVYGPRQNTGGEAGVIGILARQALAGKRSTIFGDGKQTRDFVFVDDVVDANVRAMKAGVRGVYNIGTGKETNINTIADLVLRELGSDLRPTHGVANRGEERRSCLDVRAARRALGWKPRVGIEEGISRTVAWFKAHR